MDLTPAEVLRGLHMKGILTTSAERGGATEFLCDMDECYCPQGRGYFEPISVPLTDWVPREDHYPRLKKDGGRRLVRNIRLAHRLCNRIDYGNNPGHGKQRVSAKGKQAEWHEEHLAESRADAGNRAAVDAQWMANRELRGRRLAPVNPPQIAVLPTGAIHETVDSRGGLIGTLESITKASARVIAHAADNAWDGTTGAVGGMGHTTGGIARTIGDHAVGSGDFVWDRTVEYGPKAWDWTLEAAAVTWARSKMVGKNAAELVTSHDEEILTALRMLAVGASNVVLFAAEHDTAILAAAGVIAVNQPYLLAVIATYEIGKPLVKAVAEVISELTEEDKPEPIKKADWNGLTALLPKLKQTSAPST